MSERKSSGSKKKKSKARTEVADTDSTQGTLERNSSSGSKQSAKETEAQADPGDPATQLPPPYPFPRAPVNSSSGPFRVTLQSSLGGGLKEMELRQEGPKFFFTSKKSRLEIDLSKQWKLRFPPNGGLQFMNPANKEELTVSSKSRPDFTEEVKKALPPPRPKDYVPPQPQDLWLRAYPVKLTWVEPIHPKRPGFPPVAEQIVEPNPDSDRPLPYCLFHHVATAYVAKPDSSFRRTPWFIVLTEQNIFLAKRFLEPAELAEPPKHYGTPRPWVRMPFVEKGLLRIHNSNYDKLLEANFGNDKLNKAGQATMFTIPRQILIQVKPIKKLEPLRTEFATPLLLADFLNLIRDACEFGAKPDLPRPWPPVREPIEPEQNAVSFTCILGMGTLSSIFTDKLSAYCLESFGTLTFNRDGQLTAEWKWSRFADNGEAVALAHPLKPLTIHRDEITKHYIGHDHGPMTDRNKPVRIEFKDPNKRFSRTGFATLQVFYDAYDMPLSTSDIRRGRSGLILDAELRRFCAGEPLLHWASTVQAEYFYSSFDQQRSAFAPTKWSIAKTATDVPGLHERVLDTMVPQGVL